MEKLEQVTIEDKSELFLRVAYSFKAYPKSDKVASLIVHLFNLQFNLNCLNEISSPILNYSFISAIHSICPVVSLMQFFYQGINNTSTAVSTVAIGVKN